MSVFCDWVQSMICIKIRITSRGVGSLIMCETGAGKPLSISNLDVAADDMIPICSAGDLAEMGSSAACWISCCLDETQKNL